MSHLSNERVEKMIKNAGISRVSSEAVEKMNEILSDWGKNITKHAVEIARHSGRKTIKENDIKLAAQK